MQRLAWSAQLPGVVLGGEQGGLLALQGHPGAAGGHHAQGGGDEIGLVAVAGGGGPLPGLQGQPVVDGRRLPGAVAQAVVGRLLQGGHVGHLEAGEVTDVGDGQGAAGGRGGLGQMTDQGLGQLPHQPRRLAGDQLPRLGGSPSW